MTTKESMIKVGASSEGVGAGLASGKQAVQGFANDVEGMAESVTKSAGKAKKSLAGMGEGASDSSGATNRQLKSLERQFQDIQIAAASAGKSVTESLVIKGETRFGAGALAGLSDQIEAARQAEASMTAAARAAALEAEAMRVNAAAAKDAAAVQAAFARSVQNAEIQMLSLGKTASQRLEIQAAKLNIPKDFSQPLIDSLKATELEAEKAATGIAGKAVPALNSMGMSAAATANAMRMVPAQFTDIVVSLQSGQKPLTVLMQQGGQLKDMFGGVGNALKAMGSYVLGLINPFTLAAAAVGVLTVAWMQGRAESEAFNKAILLTGDSSGATTAQLQRMAESVGKATGATTGAAADALAQFAANGNIASTSFEKFAGVAILMSKNMGIAVADSVKAFEDLGKDPVAASIKLNEHTHYLTLSVYEQIKALEEQGRTLDAGKMAQQAYADAMTSRMPALTENLGLAEKAWRAIASAAKNAWDAMLDIGRKSDPLTQLKDQLSTAETALANIKGNGPTSSLDDAQATKLQKTISALKEQIGYYSEGERLSRRSADNHAEIARKVEAQIAFDKMHDQYLSKAVQQEREIAAATELYKKNKDVPGNAQKYLETLAGIEKKYKDVRDTALDANIAIQEGIKKAIAATDEELGIKDKLSAAQKFELDTEAKISEQLKKGAITQKMALEDRKQMAIEVKKLNDLDAQKKGFAEDEAAQKRLVESLKVEQSVRYDIARAIEQVNRSATEQNGLLDVEMRMAGATNSERAVAISQYKNLVALEKELDKIRAATYETPEKKLQAMNDARSAFEAKGLADIRQINQTEWMNIANTIQTSLTDAFMNAVDGAKSLFVALRDSVVSLFKNLVLRPIVNAIVSPISQGLTAAMASGSASAASGGGSMAGSVLGSVIGSAGLFGSAAMAGFAATLEGGFTAAMSSGFTALASGSLSASMAGAGAIVGALLPIAIATAGLYAIAQATSGETRAGGQYGYSFNGTNVLDNRSGSMVNANGVGATYLQGPSGGDPLSKAVKPLINVTVTGINDRFKNIGSSTRLTGYQAAYETSGDNRGGVLAGGTLSSGATFGQSGAGSNYAGTLYDPTKGFNMDVKQASAAFSLELKQSQIEALQAATDLPKTLKTMLQDSSGAWIDAAQLSDEESTAILNNVDTVISSVKAFGDAANGLPMENIKNLSFDATAELIKFGGGIQALSAGISSYYQNFYSAEEQRTQGFKNINQALKDAGLEGVDASKMSRDQFRALAEAQDLSTEKGQKAYAALMLVSGSFASLVPAVDAAGNSITSLLQKLRDEGVSLKDQWDQLTMSQADYRAQKLAGMSAEEAAQQQANWTYQDNIDAYKAQQQAAQAAATAAQQAADAAAAAAKQMKDAWQTTTDSLMKEVARIRGVMAGTGASGYALAQARFGIATAQARAGDQNAANSLPELSQSMLSLAETNTSTMVDLQRIQGTTASTLEGLGAQFTKDYGLRALETSQAILTETQGLRADIALLRAETQSSASSSDKVARILTRVSPDGNSLSVIVAA